MAQKRYHEFQAAVTTPLLNMSRTGLHTPGRYAGFDQISVSGNAVDLIFGHGGGPVLVDPATGLYTNNLGVILTQQGVTITEDSPIQLFVDGQTANTTNRIDLLVVDHLYNPALPGGNAAVYSIVQGPFGSYTKPAVPNPLRTQVVAEIHLLGIGMGIANLFNNGLVDVRPTPAPGNGGRVMGSPFCFADFTGAVSGTSSGSTTQGFYQMIGHNSKFPFNFALNGSNHIIMPMSGYYKFDMYVRVTNAATAEMRLSAGAKSSRVGSLIGGTSGTYIATIMHPVIGTGSGLVLSNTVSGEVIRGETICMDWLVTSTAAMPGGQMTGQLGITYLGPLL